MRRLSTRPFPFPGRDQEFSPSGRGIAPTSQTSVGSDQRRGAVRVTALENCLRRFIVLQSAHAPTLTAWIGGVIDSLDKRGQEEPMINMVTWYAKKEWTVLIFPRERQRPWQYDAEEPLKMVVSPAAVELCGIVILPAGKISKKLLLPTSKISSARYA